MPTYAELREAQQYNRRKLGIHEDNMVKMKNSRGEEESFHKNQLVKEEAEQLNEQKSMQLYKKFKKELEQLDGYVYKHAISQKNMKNPTDELSGLIRKMKELQVMFTGKDL